MPNENSVPKAEKNALWIVQSSFYDQILQLLDFHEAELFDTLLKDVEPLYDRLPYHNFEHVKEVTKNAVMNAQVLGLDKNDPQLITILIYAGQIHDAGYHETLAEVIDKIGKKITSKEDYSIYLRETYADEHDIDELMKKRVSGAIDATKIFNRTFDTEEKKLLRGADLHNLGSAYEIFIGNTHRLMKESQLLDSDGWHKNPQLKEKLFREAQVLILGQLLSQKSLVPEQYFLAEKTGFYPAFQDNFAQMEKNYLPEKGDL